MEKDVNSPKTTSDVENGEPLKYRYPKRVFLIVANECIERFNFYGKKAILALYIKNKLGYSEDNATAIFHVFAMAMCLMCFFGGIIADGWFGSYRTILHLSLIHAIGSTIISVSSILYLNLAPHISLFIGLLFIAIGSGGIKPVVFTFCGDQFKIPEQEAQFASFFPIFYLILAIASLLSSVITPILRADISCFGDDDCFPLAFGLPSVLMFVATVIFFMGKSSYSKKRVASENMVLNVINCIMNAIKLKTRDKLNGSREQKKLLDYSIGKYDEQLVDDTRNFLRILIIFAPIPIYLASFDQKSSRWTFQASRLDGNFGFYILKPDQLQMAYVAMVLCFIPMFECMVYPILKHVGIRRPLQKISLGLVAAVLAFLLAALLQIKIESSPENSINVMWILPQFVALAISEVLVQVTVLAFAYEQAPKCMKSVVLAFLLLNGAVGNLITVIITKLALFNSQAHEFLLYAGLMCVGTLLFIALTYKFESKIKIEDHTHTKNDNDEYENNNNNRSK